MEKERSCVAASVAGYGGGGETSDCPAERQTDIEVYRRRVRSATGGCCLEPSGKSVFIVFGGGAYVKLGDLSFKRRRRMAQILELTSLMCLLCRISPAGGR